MVCLMIEAHIFIVKTYYKNGDCVAGTHRKLVDRFGRQRSRTAQQLEQVSLLENPRTSTRRRTQETGTSKTTSQRILHKDLLLFAHEVQIIQELHPYDHLKRVNFVDWTFDQR